MIDTSYWLNSLSPALTRASWQGGILVMLVWSLCRFISSIPAYLQCWLWRLVLVKFLVTLFWISPVDLPILPTTEAGPVSHIDPENLISQQAAPIPIPDFTDVPSPLVPFLLWLWLALVGCHLALLARHFFQARFLLQVSSPITDPVLLGQLATNSRIFGLAQSPQLLESNNPSSPLLMGLLSPTIILPARAWPHLCEREMALVLSHELAHHRRRDLPWTIFAALVRAVFFFHPLVWLAVKRLKLVQEIAADNLAHQRQSLSPAEYGSLLVSIVSKLGPVRVLPTMSVGTAGSLDSLKERLVAMRYFGSLSRTSVFSTSLVLGLIALVGIIPWRLVQAAQPLAPEEKCLYEARIKFSETAPGKETVVDVVRILFVHGIKEEIKISLKARRLVARLESDSSKNPMTHRIHLKIIQSLDAKNGDVVLFRPTLELQNNSTGTASIISKNGTMNVEVQVEEVKLPQTPPPKRAPETPAGK